MLSRMVAAAIVASFVVVSSGSSAHADVCSKYRVAINVLIFEAKGVIALEDALDAARKGMRATRATRTSLKTLETEEVLAVVEAAGAATREQLTEADAAAASAMETFEAIYEQVTAVGDRLAVSRRESFDVARRDADAAAGAVHELLDTLQSMTHRGALAATTAAAATSPGRTTSRALISAHEGLHGAACE